MDSTLIYHFPLSINIMHLHYAIQQSLQSDMLQHKYAIIGRYASSLQPLTL